ncbi:B-cell receptor CD22-like isoform X3 [Simochromis diagramma]|uniref:B-cell receptor CD22-like isoform X3 n=1 Tax=Simochromis diagramma TaxID=43689 RepID=UPI001A7EF652|nr:B-cell receptor CD22-like isoform X3 [Simochromis diagramma]
MPQEKANFFSSSLKTAPLWIVFKGVAGTRLLQIHIINQQLCFIEMRGTAMSLIAATCALLVLLSLTGTAGSASIWVVREGEDLSLYNLFTVSGNTKFFCKEKCERAENILIKTDETTAQSGRFSIKYKDAASGRGRLTFTITNMRKSDSGMYRFGLGKSSAPDSYSDFEVRVSNEIAKNSRVSRAQSEGEEISFPCATAVQAQRKFLCKNPCEKEGNIFIDTTNDKVQNGRYSIEYTKGSGFELLATIRHLTKSDTGQYRCGYGDPLSPDSYHTEIILVVDVVTYSSTQVCAFKGSTAEIHSTFRYLSTINDINTRIQKMFWFTTVKDNEPVDLKTDPEYSGRVQYQCENNDCTLRISDLRESDSAEYKFMLITNDPGGKYTGSPGVTLTVTDPQLQVHVRRSTVNSYSNWTELTCHNNCQLPDQSSYIWYKNGHKLSSEKQYLQLNTSDTVDSLYCAVKGYETFPSPTVYAPKLPSVSVSPSAEIVEGSSVTLTCSSDANPAASYTWYKEDVINPLRYRKQHFFRSIRPSQSGKYYCTADNGLGQKRSESRNIDVKYAPKLPSVSVSPSAEIAEGSSVTLTCSSDANPAASYTWYKEDVINPLSYQNQHVFSSILPSDSGKYYCTADNDLGQKRSESRNIDVKYAPKLPSVSVSPSAEIVEGSSVTLTCSSDANPAANYTWYKEDENLPKAFGQNFTVTKFRPEHSGRYYCEAQNKLGRHNSTLQQTIVPGAKKIKAAGVTAAVLLSVTSLPVFLWIRKKRNSKESSKTEGSADNKEQCLSDQEEPQEQDDLQYASIHFSKNQADPLYSNSSSAPQTPGGTESYT